MTVGSEQLAVASKYRAYPEYKDSGVEWLGMVPEHWNVLPTKRFFRLVAEPAPDNNDYELLSVYTEIGVKPRKELEQKGNKASTTDGYWLVRKGDIIVNKLLAWMGAVGYSEYEGVTSPAYDILRPIKKFNPKFYHYLFRNRIAQQEFKRWSRGIMEMRLRLYFEELGRILMPFPPSEEIDIITNFLDHETTRIDTLIEEQKTLIRLLQEKRQAVISHAVTKGLNPDSPMKDSGVEWLGEVPEHWIVRRLKHVADLQSGIPKGKDLAGKITIEVPMLRVANVQDGYLKLNEVHKIHIEPDQLERYELKKGDVLMNEGGDNDKLGRGAVWKGEIAPCIHQNHVFAIRPKDIEPEWLALLTGSSYAKFHFYRVAKQSTNLASISSSNIKETPLVIPPFEERRAIIDHLKILMKKYDAIEAQGQDQVRLLTERRTALISAAITGKIDVRDWKPTAHPQQKHPEAPHEQTA